MGEIVRGIGKGMDGVVDVRPLRISGVGRRGRGVLN